MPSSYRYAQYVFRRPSLAISIILLPVVFLSSCSKEQKAYHLGRCWTGTQLPLGQRVEGKVLLYYAEDIPISVYPIECNGVGVLADLPENVDLGNISQHDIEKSWMGGFFFIVDIEASVSRDLEKGRPRLQILHFSNINVVQKPKWINDKSI